VTDSGSERQVPFYCPYCGEEDLVPDGPDGGTWACGSCARSFALRYVGLTTATQGGAR
jgi:transcription elongation factor Elf1